MKEQKKQDDYTDKFIECQKKIKAIISQLPVGIQNWSHDKTVKLKRHLNECEAKIKLLPKSKHPELLRAEAVLRELEQYYK